MLNGIVFNCSLGSEDQVSVALVRLKCNKVDVPRGSLITSLLKHQLHSLQGTRLLMQATVNTQLVVVDSYYMKVCSLFLEISIVLLNVNKKKIPDERDPCPSLLTLVNLSNRRIINISFRHSGLQLNIE